MLMRQDIGNLFNDEPEAWRVSLGWWQPTFWEPTSAISGAVQGTGCYGWTVGATDRRSGRSVEWKGEALYASSTEAMEHAAKDILALDCCFIAAQDLQRISDHAAEIAARIRELQEA